MSSSWGRIEDNRPSNSLHLLPVRKTGYPASMSLRPLFVTQVYEASLAASPGFESFNAGLADACRMLPKA